MDQPLHIVQVSTADVLGGAERVAWNLFAAYRGRGHHSQLVVGRKSSDDEHVLRVPHHLAANPWRRLWWRAYLRLQRRYLRSAFGAKALCRMTQRLAEPWGLLDSLRGVEDLHYPGAWRLLDAVGGRPDVVHCHNLHGGYFDLRSLPWLSEQVPVMMTLHDAWLLSGHCAHSFDCERWRSGCGECPDLSIYPAIRRDATEYNWRRKRDIYAQSRLYVATPSRWLMGRVEQSMLAPAIRGARVIPNGVDLAVFKPADRQVVRAELGLPAGAAILLFAGYGIRRNPWKDYQTMRDAVGRVASQCRGRSVILIGLGEQGGIGDMCAAEVRFVPFESDRARVAKYYQAADVYLHAARADTFPNSVIEASACGTPVVATAVGGIPEQVKASVVSRELGCAVDVLHGEEESTGVLVAPKDPAAMARAVLRLLCNASMRRRMGQRAVADARERFDVQRQVNAYLDWYEEIITRGESPGGRQTAKPQCETHRARVIAPVSSRASF